MGSKRKLVSQLLQHLPQASFKVYHEPFLGSGSLLYALQPQEASVSDCIEPLMSLHSAVASETEMVMSSYRQLCETGPRKQVFLDIRAAYPNISPAEFLFLMKNCHASRFRINKQGKFNCPYKISNSPTICPRTIEKDEQKLKTAAAYSSSAKISFKTCDVMKALQCVCEGDLLFLDPPYQLTDIGEPDYGNRFGLVGWQKLFLALDQLPHGVFIMLMLPGTMLESQLRQFVNGVANLKNIHSLHLDGTCIHKGGVVPRSEWLVTNYSV